MPSVSIGVCVYNEEENIRNLLISLLNQRTSNIIKEIIVVSSACSDKTNEIIENDFLKFDHRIILINQDEREGKASAINLFLEHAKGDIVVLISGDILPAFDAIEKLTAPFNDPKTGMTGGHPIPTNDPDTLIGHTVHLIWDLHHKISLRHPKLGEMIAFRRHLINKIPVDTAVDEAFMEALITKQGYELKYAHDAIVNNRGPKTLTDFFRQRRRIFAGHLHLKKTAGYAPSSMDKLEILKLMLKDIRLDPKKMIMTLCAMFLEINGRLLGVYDFYIRKKNPFIWDIARTTKVNLYEQKNININPNISVHPVSSFGEQVKLWTSIRHQTDILYGSKMQLRSPLLADTSAAVPDQIAIMPGAIPGAVSRLPVRKKNIDVRAPETIQN